MTARLTIPRTLHLELLQKDNRLHYYKKENGGVAAARNFGIANANGQYILPLDADDKINSEYIGQAVKHLTHDEEIKVVYCELEFFGELSGKWELPPFSLQELARNNIIFCCALFRKSDWEKVGGFDENMKQGYEDWEFWINLLKSGGKVVLLPFVGFYYRIKQGSRNASVNEAHKRLLETYICKKHFDFMVQQLGNPIYLSEQVNAYKSQLDAISGKPLYRLYKRVKALF